MTKSKVLLSIVMGLAILILVSSCLKEDSKIGQNSSLELRNTVPYVINGMLHFDNYSDFELYIQNLEELENDSNQVKMAYAHLGVDLTQEFLPNLTDHPVALRMEQQMSGFVSARKAEETIINNALNNGDNSVFSIVSDPFLKKCFKLPLFSSNWNQNI